MFEKVGLFYASAPLMELIIAALFSYSYFSVLDIGLTMSGML